MIIYFIDTGVCSMCIHIVYPIHRIQYLQTCMYVCMYVLYSTYLPVCICGTLYLPRWCAQCVHT